MDIYCKVTPYGLIPLYDSDGEARKKLKPGSVVKCKITLSRNYEFHKKFFALVRLCFDNLPTHLADKLGVHNEQDMLKCIKQDLSLFKVVKINGREAIEYGSIAFSAMDNAEFERFYQGAVDLVLYKYMKGTNREDLLQEIEDFK